jgi:NagD protein
MKAGRSDDGFAITRSKKRMATKEIETWLTDMDGVLVHENTALPGAAEFIEELKRNNRRFLVLTNNPIFTPRDLSARLKRSGIDVPEEFIWTSALATAEFVSHQIPNGSAYVIGEAGLTTALHEAGYILSDNNPDYVILGETRTYSFESLTTAIRLILAGSRFICTNPDPTGPSERGILPAAGSVAALITKATGKEPYFVGKPNPVMFRTALNRVGGHSETTAMIGDRMDTDVIAGVEAGLNTFLVLSGITKRDEVEDFPFRPNKVVDGIKDLVEVAKTGQIEI